MESGMKEILKGLFSAIALGAMIWAIGLAVNRWIRNYNLTIIYVMAAVIAGIILVQSIVKALKPKTQEPS